jgi:beta-galactosidase/beta-glucuronidase
MPFETTLSVEPQAPTGHDNEPQPRPEYPRPQLWRPEWMNLNGFWDFAFDDLDVGLHDEWYTGRSGFGRRIRVPFKFEADQSSIGDRGFHERVWYRREIRIPPSWSEQQRILLHFGAVDYRATVWVNGMVVGAHEGGHTPFTCDITCALNDGRGVLVVRAEDPPTDRYIPRGKQHWEERPASIFYARTTGIWQTVWMEPVPESYISHVKITPLIDGTVKFAFKIAHPEAGQFVKVVIREDTRFLANSISVASGPLAATALFVDHPKFWSPESPHLYEATLELHTPEGAVDTVETYFGYRSISTQDGKVLLNGNPYYLKTALDQGYWPQSNLTPPSDEAIQADIRMTKELGFNGVRKHQKVEDPRYLYWADKMGLLVSGEMANAYQFNDDSVARVTREWMEVIGRDYNHPCIALRNELKDTGITITALMPGPTETNFFHRAGMDDTKVGSSEKDDAAEVAAEGCKALMAGKDKVIAGSFKNSLMGGLGAHILSDTVKAELHRKQAEPQPAKK